MYLGKKCAVPKKGLQKQTSDDLDRRGAGFKESEIQKQCEDYLNIEQIRFIRIPDALYKYVFSAQSRLPAYMKALISSFIKGVPDITILLKNGRFLCCELKTTTGKLSQGQKNFQRSVGESNYFIIRSVEALVELVKKTNIVEM